MGSQTTGWWMPAASIHNMTKQYAEQVTYVATTRVIVYFRTCVETTLAKHVLSVAVMLAWGEQDHRTAIWLTMVYVQPWQLMQS